MISRLILSRRERRVFVDTGFYAALMEERDEHHAEAIALSTLIAENQFQPYTTNAILIEAHALIMSSLGIQAGIQFLNDMDESSTTEIRVRASDEQRAKQKSVNTLTKISHLEMLPALL